VRCLRCWSAWLWLWLLHPKYPHKNIKLKNDKDTKLLQIHVCTTQHIFTCWTIHHWNTVLGLCWVFSTLPTDWNYPIINWHSQEHGCVVSVKTTKYQRDHEGDCWSKACYRLCRKGLFNVSHLISIVFFTVRCFISFFLFFFFYYLCSSNPLIVFLNIYFMIFIHTPAGSCCNQQEWCWVEQC
jgi:hypothetical protein